MHLNAKACESYYCAQVGGGDAFFQGMPHQRGYGFFGDLRRYITPLALKAGHYLGRRIWQTGKNVISDVASGSTIKDATRKRLKETSKQIKSDIFEKLHQHGRGIKRRSTKRKHQSKKKRRKTEPDIFS